MLTRDGSVLSAYGVQIPRRSGPSVTHPANTHPEEFSTVVDITSLITLQARSRRNALRAARQLHRERLQAEEARNAVAAAQVTHDFAEANRAADFRKELAAQAHCAERAG